MSVAQLEADKLANKRVRKLIEDTRDLEPAERIEVLEAEVKAVQLERELQLVESFSLLFGGAGGQELVSEHPVHDDGEPWDSLGAARSFRNREGRRWITLLHQESARAIGRKLAFQNEFVIGSMTNRCNYLVGEGLTWKVVPRTKADADPGMQAAAQNVIDEWRERENLPLFEWEFVWISDAEGEAFPRLFANGWGLPKIRYMDPDQLVAPPIIPAELGWAAKHAAQMGVITDARDVQDVHGFSIREDPRDEIEIVPAWNDAVGIPHVEHSKLNVRMADPRGWPTYWPINSNMARAEKLLRNMSYVAALQAAIALIRKHETAGKARVQATLDRNKSFTTTNSLTGQTTSHRGIPAGSVLDAPKGTSYTAPVSSVEADKNVKVLGAELRSGAVCVVQPEYMFAGDTSKGGYATTLVTDGPPSKNFKSLQALRIKRPFMRLHMGVLRHEEFFGRLTRGTTKRFKLEVSFPSVIVRDELQETQRHQALRAMGAISMQTIRRREGLDHDIEERNLDAEEAAGRPRPTGADPVDLGAIAGVKPPPGSTAGGPGGADQRGDPNSPGTAAGAMQKF